MNTNQVLLDCNAARQQAAELREQAREVNKSISTYSATLDELEQVWTGMSARTYLTKARKHIDILKQVPARLEQIADAIEKTAALFQKDALARGFSGFTSAGLVNPNVRGYRTQGVRYDPNK